MSRQLRDPGERVAVVLPAWIAALRDRGVRALLVLAAVTATGFVVMAIAWKGAAATPYVPLQVPWLVSGGLVGLALIGTSVTAAAIFLARRADALHRREMEELVATVAALADDPQRLRQLARRRQG